MEQFVLKNFTKYQKSWPLQKCQHEGNTQTVGSRFKYRKHPTSAGKTRKAKTINHEPAQVDLPDSTSRSPYTTATKESELGIHVQTSSQYQHASSYDTCRPSSRRDRLRLPTSSQSDITTTTQAVNSRLKSDPGSILRTYDTKKNYGTLYQLRKLQIHGQSGPLDKGDNWFWQKDYKLWRKHYKKHVFGDSSDSEGSEIEADAKPHPDLYGAFNSRDLQKQLEEKGATTIQKLVRGWLVRRQLYRLRQTADELRLSWDNGLKEYLSVRSKVKERLHILQENRQLDLHDVKSFLEQKKEYEDVFKRLSTLSARGRTIPTRDLRDFFTACGLNPSDREINNAFKSVFRLSTDLEFVVLVDRSADSGPLALKTHLTIAKDILSSLSKLTAVSRVDLVPFDETADDVISIQVNGIDSSEMDSFTTKIDEIKFRGGQRNSHLALEKLRQCFQSSSPGATKIGIVLTGGSSSDPENTSVKTSLAGKENISLFTIGIGHGGSEQDISPPGNAYLVSGKGAWQRISIQTLQEIVAKAKFSSEGHTGLYSEELCRPLTREEVLAILWTIYPPRGVASRHQRRSTWLHPIVDGQEASPALEEEMGRQTDLLPCIRLMVQSRLARDGFVILPCDGPSGSRRVHELQTAVFVFQDYLQSGKLDHLLS